MKKHIIGRSIVNLQYSKNISIVLEKEYPANDLILEIKIQSSLYLKTNTVFIEASSQSRVATKELLLEGKGKKLLLTDLGFNPDMKIQSLRFSCNYDMVLQVNILLLYQGLFRDLKNTG